MNILVKDITTVKRGIICQQVNSLGYMGAGLALAIRRKWPIVYEQYSTNVPNFGEVQEVVIDATKPLIVFNMCAQPTIGPGLQTSYAYLETCLEQAAIMKHALPVFFPWKLSCGLAGGNWDVVIKLLLKHFIFATICIKP